MPKKSEPKSNRDELINAKVNTALTEYKNIHDRVFYHMKYNERITIQIIIIIGVLLYYCVNQYTNIANNLFVDIIIFILIPLIILSMVIISLAISIKITAFGEYLATVEKRINNLLECKNDKILDWEHWRISHGYVKDKILFFETAIIYIIIVLGMIVFNIIRVCYINVVYHSSYTLIWIVLAPIIYQLIVNFFILLNNKASERQEKLERVLNDERISYGAHNNGSPKKKGVIKTIFINATIYLVIVITVLSFFQFSIYDTSKTSEITWLTSPIAHRGLHTAEFPENTLVAFENAIKNGYAIELDVMNTLDGVPVVFHDENAERLCGVNKKIDQMKLSEVKQLKVNSSDKIPTLEESLKLIDGKVPVIIEIKNNYFAGKLEESVANLLYDYYGYYIIQSYNPLSLEWFKINFPNAIRCQLYADWGGVTNLIFRLRNNIFNSISNPNIVGYDRNIVKFANIDEDRKKGLKSIGWIFGFDEMNTYDSKRYFDFLVCENQLLFGKGYLISNKVK